MEQEKELTENKNQISQNLLFKGDISGLNNEQKWQYYQFMCQRLELDPLSQPFQIIKFMAQGNKEVLYCTKGGCEQLSNKQGVSHQILEEKEQNDLYIVKARATLPNNRFVEDIGIVDISNKRGNDLANLKMKAITKAKRRATLSLLGLGMLDETEIETISNVKSINISPLKETNGNGGKKSPTSNKSSEICADCNKEIANPRVVEYSNQFFGEAVCYECQNLRKNPPKDKQVYLAEGKGEYEYPELGEPEHEEVI